MRPNETVKKLFPDGARRGRDDRPDTGGIFQEGFKNLTGLRGYVADRENYPRMSLDGKGANETCQICDSGKLLN